MEAIYGKVTSAAIDELAKSSVQDTATPAGGESPFKTMLSEMDSSGEDMVKILGITPDASISTSKIETMSASEIKINMAEMQVGLEKPKGIDKVVDMLSDVNKGQMQMDNLVNEILYSGKRFSNQELLAMQAHVFHFAQMTELTVKVVDQGLGSVKQLYGQQFS